MYYVVWLRNTKYLYLRNVFPLYYNVISQLREWARSAILAAGKGRGGSFLFSISSFSFIFLFPLSLFFISMTISSISLLPFSGRQHNDPQRVDVLLNPNSVNQSPSWNKICLSFKTEKKIGCLSDWWSGDCRFDPRWVGNILLWRLIMKFSTVILCLLLIQEGQLSTSGKRICTILINRYKD